LITIFGVALGPQQGAAADPAHLPTSLAGTTVTFDGTPVPILYASYYQINVQVPFSLTPGATTQVKVQSTGGATGNVAMDVLSSAVGLFTAQSNGAGQVLAVNVDGTVNSASAPAAAGSYISLYATGLGAVTPPVNTGTPAPSSPLSTVNGTIAVVVGGLSAPVTFAGLAPGFTGLYQINIQLPSTLASGRRRVFIVAPNGYASQSGAFIQVR
jgi:adhesin/invasin